MTTKRISLITGAILAAGIALGTAGAASAAPSLGNLNPSEIVTKSDVTTVSHRFRRGGYRYWRGRSHRRCRRTYRWVRYYGTWVKRFAGYRCYPRYRRSYGYGYGYGYGY